VEAWERVSPHEFVHISGARIERRGFSSRQGWYLVPAAPEGRARRYEPTVDGCDRAFYSFMGGA